MSPIAFKVLYIDSKDGGKCIETILQCIWWKNHD